jgi:uncharacterized protein (TIGR00369 family)
VSDRASGRRWVGRKPASVRGNRCFACGPLNGRGLRLDIQHDGAVTYAAFVPDEDWQGVAGVVHGGLVATVLDEVMAWELYGHDDFAVTARLAVTYRQPVPIGEPLRATAQLVEARRRARRVRAELRDRAGTVLAQAEALFMAVPQDREAELRRRYPQD